MDFFNFYPWYVIYEGSLLINLVYFTSASLTARFSMKVLYCDILKTLNEVIVTYGKNGQNVDF